MNLKELSLQFVTNFLSNLEESSDEVTLGPFESSETTSVEDFKFAEVVGEAMNSATGFDLGQIGRLCESVRGVDGFMEYEEDQVRIVNVGSWK